MKKLYSVILCGGRGSRLESITENIPKSLVQVHGKPLLWYTLLNLHKHGFNKFIFPLGYKGDMIEKLVTNEFHDYDFEMHFIQTGRDTPVAKRLKKAINIIPNKDDFFMLNGDTFFDFDIDEMYRLHKSKGSLLTLSSVELVSSYGLIVEKNNVLTDFKRDSNIAHVSLDATQNILGYINAGLIWVNKQALDFVDLDTCKNLEKELFPKLIKKNKVSHYKIQGNWFAIDTQKDLKIINEITNIGTKIGDVVKMAKKNLESRYSYRTQYFSSEEELKDKILNKTIIPHQVEVQPGPLTGNICWLKCPYCYGGTADDTKERLSPERYVKVLSEIADGGVDKIVFAGYATDPLNYKYIEELHKVTLSSSQIFGFHTKAIKISDKLISQITDPNIRALSYFSVSVDSGFNDSYNKFHGVPNSKAKLYDKVCNNIRRISDARNKSGANLDISATYLISSMNNSSEEILKSINDLRDAGVDLIRFSFPQKPRGYNSSLKEFIPEREEVSSDLNRLRKLIENENGKGCQVLIMDLDAEYSTDNIPRTLPCFARYIFPSIGFDGWLAHCSESGSPHFREMSLGNLQERGFWDMFYDYDANNLAETFENYTDSMNRLGCKCDRKEHVVNARIKKSGVFDELITSSMSLPVDTN